jgi:hypothetical protein
VRLPYLLAAFLACGLAARPAGAAADRDPRETEAKKRCAAGDAKGGIALLAELYALTNETTYIYNQARCYQQNGATHQAILRFQEYLRKETHVTPDERAKIDGYIKELSAGERRDELPALPVPSIGSALTTPSRVPESPPPEAADERPLALGGLVIGGGIATVAGLALTGTGIAFEVKARSKAQQSAQAPVYDPNLDDSARSARTTGYVLIGAGAAAVVGGVAATVLGLRQRQGLALLPSIDRRTVSLTAVGRF